MRYVSLCSGVEAASVAWVPLGWEPLAFAEIDEFAASVLAHRFPDVPNLGDISKIDWRKFHDENGIIDVLIGGTPCTSFSIAGNRLGRAGESGLMSEYIRAVRELVLHSEGTSPRYIVWENVPGALSSERGAAFGQLLTELDALGYGLAWRVLDAQFVRVPDRQDGGFIGPVAQRRRRVFLVGSLGSPGAAEILFERESLRWDNTPNAGQRERIASDPAESAQARRGDRAVMCMASLHTNTEIADGIATTQIARQYKDPPTIVIDRAAYNQGENAQYHPHVEQKTLMDTLVARGQHAVCFPAEPNK